MADELSAHNRAIREALAMAANDSDAAISMLDAALEEASTPEAQATIAKHAGAISQGTGELRRAADFYRRAAAVDPSDAYVHLALGQLYGELGQLEDARASLALCLVAAEGSVDQDLSGMARRAMLGLGDPPSRGMTSRTLADLARILVEALQVTVPLRDEHLTLRIEIFESLNCPRHYSAQIWRLEHYRLQPTFPQHDGEPVHVPSDEVILKEFEGFESPLVPPREFADAASARRFVLSALADWLNTLE